MAHSVESLREQVKRETLARALAQGDELEAAAQVAGLSVFAANEALQDEEFRALVLSINPEAVLPAPLATDPLAIIEKGAHDAARQLVASANTPAGAKALLELAIKYRSAAAETPAHITVQLPKSQVSPLLAALTEFNSLLDVLVKESDGSAST